MFITERQDELSLATILSVSATQHWRMVELAMHIPWFVLTLEVFDGEASFKRTLCIAWDTDLVEVIESLDEGKPVALLCMTPGWCSPGGQWSARTVSEVWHARTGSGDPVVLLRDRRGIEFGDRRGAAQEAPLRERRLVLKLDSPDTDRSMSALANQANLEKRETHL